jgi:hypothetical protein
LVALVSAHEDRHYAIPKGQRSGRAEILH